MKLKQEDNILISVVRKTRPSLIASALKDFLQVLKDNDDYQPENFNWTTLSYKVGNNEIEFFSVDEPQKVRGRKRTYLWANEINELEYEDFIQLALRTTKQIFGDYNPSDEYHWIYERLLTRNDVTLIKSTFRDNPFLEKETIDEIKRLRSIDENYWRIYGLGERGVSETIIYRNWDLVDELPTQIIPATRREPERTEFVGDVYYSLDFGFNNKTCLLRIVENDKEVFIDELIYESGLTNSELIAKMKELNIGGLSYIYCDSAEPQRIKELRNADFNAVPANKDVLKGIDTLKSRRIHITKRSVNVHKEIRSYRWKEKDGKVLDEPVKVNDHAMDSMRYGVHTNSCQEYIGFV